MMVVHKHQNIVSKVDISCTSCWCWSIMAKEAVARTKLGMVMKTDSLSLLLSCLMVNPEVHVYCTGLVVIRVYTTSQLFLVSVLEGF